MCAVMDAADNKNDELKTNLNGNVKIESPLVKKPDDYERDDRPADSDNVITTEQENTGQEKCSIPGLPTQVVENLDVCEPDDKAAESDARIIPPLEKTDEENCCVSELQTPVVIKLDNCEPDDRPVESDADVFTELENTGQEKCSIPELPTPVVEEADVCEPGDKAEESDAGKIPVLENTSQENTLIPELPGLKILEYANKIRAFMGLEDGPDVAKDSSTSEENKESDKHESMEPELDENAMDKNEHASITLGQPHKVDTTNESNINNPIDESNIDNPIDESNIDNLIDESNIDNPIYDNECSLGVEDILSKNKKLGNESVATASIDTNLNGITKDKNKRFNNVEDICNSQETEDKPVYQKEVLNEKHSIPSTRYIKGEMDKSKVENYVDPDIVCGIGSFKPQWLQPWATARVYIVLYSIIGILSGSYYSYLIACISTLEKRFAFKSKLSGSVMMLDEITPLFLGVLVGYFGGRAHRPRMVAFGMMMSSLACFVSALPYFIYGPADHLHSMSFQNTTVFDKCEADVKVEECNEDDRPPTLAAVLFLMLGSFLKGFGNLAYYAVGLAYMDDNAKKKNTPIYLAFAYALRLLGPLVGFLMSYFFLKYYENPFVDPGFGPEDPRWIGGWWMGFMLQGVLVMVFSAPIALFPRRLPGHKLAAATVRKGEGLVSNLAGLWAALKRLGKNPIYIFLVINTIGVIFGGFGHYIMLPKYMENQFRVSASQASLISGPPGISALIVSTLLGGYLVYRFRPNARFLTGGLAILEVVGAVGFLILTIPKCESIQMSNYGFDGQGLILEGACNANCSCSTKAFTPVCAPDGKTHFFSPCHAGCQGKVNQTFTECSCISDSFGLDEDSTTEGFCITHGCWNQALIYIITLPIISFIVNILKIANTMVFLRCINTEDKSVALGTFETFLSAFGFIPYPVVFGALVDSACLVWEKSCGQTGNCWFYDVSKFNYLLHGASALFTGLSALCMFVVFCLSGRMKDMYKEDDELDENPKEQNIDLNQKGASDQ